MVMAASELAWSMSVTDQPDTDPAVAALPATGLEFTQRRVDLWHKGEVILPAIISCELDLATPRYVTLPSLVAAKRKPKQSQIATTAMPLEMPQRWSSGVKAKAPTKKLSSLNELVELLTQTEQVQAEEVV